MEEVLGSKKSFVLYNNGLAGDLDVEKAMELFNNQK